MARRVDLEKLRAAIRRMSRSTLLVIADRAVGLVPRTRLGALVGDVVELDEAKGKSKKGKGPPAKPLLDEIQEFHEAGMRGDYYEGFAVNSRNFMQTSEKTDAFNAEFGRLLDKCIGAADGEASAGTREAFDLLFGLLRRIDEGKDEVVFFADEGGSWQVGVDWRFALAAYFQCLAAAAPPEDFAREVDRAITDFAEHERPRHLSAARRAANPDQRTALFGLLASRGGKS